MSKFLGIKYAAINSNSPLIISSHTFTYLAKLRTLVVITVVTKFAGNLSLNRFLFTEKTNILVGNIRSRVPCLIIISATISC